MTEFQESLKIRFGGETIECGKTRNQKDREKKNRKYRERRMEEREKKEKKEEKGM